MNKLDVLAYVLIGFILIVCGYIYFETDSFQLKCIVSTVDGNKYCVRERGNIQKAADLLAKVTEKCKRLVNYMKEKYPDKENVKRLVEGYNPKKIMETLPTSEYTAYSENKGEKLAFCLDTEKKNGRLIDINTLTYVALHELSHIATKSIGHTDEFWQNFKFLITEAKKIKIYNPIDYSKTPARYCGMNITDNPYYNV